MPDLRRLAVPPIFPVPLNTYASVLLWKVTDDGCREPETVTFPVEAVSSKVTLSEDRNLSGLPELVQLKVEVSQMLPLVPDHTRFEASKLDEHAPRAATKRIVFQTKLLALSDWISAPERIWVFINDVTPNGV